MKSGNLNFLESSGPLQACNGTDLPLPLHTTILKKIYINDTEITSLNYATRASLPSSAVVKKE